MMITIKISRTVTKKIHLHMAEEDGSSSEVKVTKSTLSDAETCPYSPDLVKL